MAKDLSQQVPRVTLNDGVQMPLLGFGTSGVNLKTPSERPNSSGASSQEAGGQEEKASHMDAAYEAIKHAVRCGYRFFDTAALYENEELVGRALNDAIKEGLTKRSELFVCTKVWNTAHKRRSVMLACRESLARLNLDYVDLYLIHWPCAYADYYERQQPQPDQRINPRHPSTGRLEYSDTHFSETWLGMEDVREANLARSIGVSNFNEQMIEQLCSMAGLRWAPSVNQVELHPYLSQTKMANFLAARSILLNAYCPLGAPGALWLPRGQPNVIEDPLIGELAAKYGKTRAQIILKYHLKRGIAPIPKSAHLARIEENIQLFDFELQHEDLERMLALNKNMRYCINTAGEIIDDHPLYPFREPL